MIADASRLPDERLMAAVSNADPRLRVPLTDAEHRSTYPMQRLPIIFVSL